MTVYDVIIVGAGPAGSTLAYRLAKADLNVLLEQAQMPRVKPCGGGINDLFMKNLPEGIDLQGVIEATATEAEVRYQGQTQGVYPLPEPIHMTQRKFLDQRLAHSAQDAGARLVEGFKIRDATGYDEDGLCRVWSDNDTFAGHILVGADGANSTVVPSMGLPTASNRRWRTTFVASEWDVEDWFTKYVEGKLKPGAVEEDSFTILLDPATNQMNIVESWQVREPTVTFVIWEQVAWQLAARAQTVYTAGMLGWPVYVDGEYAMRDIELVDEILALYYELMLQSGHDLAALFREV